MSDKRMSKKHLIDLLSANQVDFPATATAAQLRVLYEEHVCAGQNASVGDCVSGANLKDDDQLEIGEILSDEVNKLPSLHDVADELDQEIAELEKRRRILALRREIAELELNERIMVEKTYGRQRYDFSHIDGAVAKFSGDDSYGVVKWIADFEIALAPLRCDDDFKLMCARRLMTGTAQIWLRTITTCAWSDLRQKLLAQFQRTCSVIDILHEMALTEYDPKLGLSNYIIRMKEIASHGMDLGESELIKQIISGLKDKSSRMSLLYSARTLDDLHRVARDYDRYRREAVAGAGLHIQKKPLPGGKTSTSTEVICYNCSGKGHLSRSCTKPRRAIGSCFRCGSTDHKLQNCPAPSRNLSQVALISDNCSNSVTNQLIEEDSDTLPVENLSG